ncbi:hypothetical protein VNO78_17534 [Psophocarpus tetragonolobus]|uniref:Response regulatory domain-containing protein n=1 Tax=Psophocarpus tetragonolobus TaxID=3891 RepID=A0AAN9XLF4_PSOTE
MMQGYDEDTTVDLLNVNGADDRNHIKHRILQPVNKNALTKPIIISWQESRSETVNSPTWESLKDLDGMEGKEKDKGKEVVKPESSCSRLRVLVVDDTRTVIFTYIKMFEKIGIKNLSAAANGQEAVELYGNGQSFDLILMDKNMPDMDGIEATKKLRTMGFGGKIIGVSSSTREAHYVQEFVDAGLDGYYRKPLTEDQLKEIVEDFLI